MSQAMCPSCGKSKASRRVLDEYRYRESGLDNVVLIGGAVETTCRECSETHIYVPKEGQLLQVIAIALLMKPGHLSGPEMRFLRGAADLTQEDLAERLHVRRASVADRERKAQPRVRAGDEILFRMVIAQAFTEYIGESDNDHLAPQHHHLLRAFSESLLAHVERLWDKAAPRRIRMKRKATTWEPEKVAV